MKNTRLATRSFPPHGSSHEDSQRTSSQNPFRDNQRSDTVVKKSTPLFHAALTLVALVVPVRAEVKPNPLFCDKAMLQRNMAALQNVYRILSAWHQTLTLTR